MYRRRAGCSLSVAMHFGCSSSLPVLYLVSILAAGGSSVTSDVNGVRGPESSSSPSTVIPDSSAVHQRRLVEQHLLGAIKEEILDRLNMRHRVQARHNDTVTTTPAAAVEAPTHPGLRELEQKPSEFLFSSKEGQFRWTWTDKQLKTLILSTLFNVDLPYYS